MGRGGIDIKRVKEMILQLLQGIAGAVRRFPLTVLSLLAAAILICYMISLHQTPSLVLEKLMFTCLVGAVLGMAAQFGIERFARLFSKRPLIYGLTVLLLAGYFLILWPAPEISSEITVRTFVAVFALTCAVLWFPAFKGKADFNQVALIHFKSFFTSVLYSGVLTAGTAAIIAAIDILLFHVNNDAYRYMLTVVWVMFAPLYYLALLPVFNPGEEEEGEAVRRAGGYPKFLAILVSYIAIPLVIAYTAVLFAYFIKILVTRHWPSGQLGPMVLVYSAAGLVIFVLAGLLENRFAQAYRKVFPKILIPVIIMQVISVGIRLQAYGVTESRYYVALFAGYSLLIAIVLSLRPVAGSQYIALLAAALAIVSVIPPVDAFTVARTSQIARVEKILQAEGMLRDGKLSPKADAAQNSRIEATSILSYLEGHSSLQYIRWLPANFNMYRDMKNVFGFDPTYPTTGAEPANRYFSAGIDLQQPLDISGFDVFIQVFSNHYGKESETLPAKFTIRGTVYVLSADRLSGDEVRISVKNTSGQEVVGTGLYDLVKDLPQTGGSPKDTLPPAKMTLDMNNNGYKLRVILQNVSMNLGTGADRGVDYTATVLFGAPQ
jgi:hypothetical protein